MNESDAGDPEVAEIKLRLLAGILERVTDGFASVDAEGRCDYINSMAAQVFGLERDNILGRRIEEIFAEQTGEQVRAAYQSAMAEQNFLSLEAYHAVTNQWLGYRFHPSQDGLSMLIADITNNKNLEEDLRTRLALMLETSLDLERRLSTQEAQNERLAEANVHLQSLATTDALTSIYNYRAFKERMELEFNRRLRYHTDLSLVMLDVDAFKAYNDDYGHQAGDKALTTIAHLLRGAARTTDFVARYGGEEFAIILPDTDREGAMVMAERFRAQVENMEFDVAGITVSAGVATVVNAVSDPAQLVAAADTALYASKNGGRNRVTHVDEMNGGPLRRPLAP